MSRPTSSGSSNDGTGPMQPDEARARLRRLIDDVQPVGADEARARAASDPSERDVEVAAVPGGGTGHRGQVLIAVAAIVVALIGAGLLAWPGGDTDGGVTTGPATSSTTLGPPTTVLAPVGDDPIVSCDIFNGDEWYPISAWDRPPGDEFADDPAAKALLDYQRIVAGYASNTRADEVELEPRWRRVSESDDLVLFGAGDFDVEKIASDELGPLIAIARVTRDADGEWRTNGAGAGTCNELWVYPGEGRSIPQWWIDEALLPLDPTTTELSLSLERWQVPCGPQIEESDIVGPDVIETGDSITIRAALDVPQITTNDAPDACPIDTVSEHADDPPVTITVHLREPLGDRQVYDGNQYPARAIRMEPAPQREQAPPAPTIELPDGENEVQVTAVSNSDCTTEAPTPCGIPSAQVDLTVTSEDESSTGSTDEGGSATLVVPDGLVRVQAEADGLWCPTVHFNGERFPGSLIVMCTHLDLPHATIAGTLQSSGAGDGWVVTFVGPSMMDSVAVAVEPDGSFSAVLPPGTWRVGAMNTDWTQTCTIGPVQSIDVGDGVDQTLDLTCN